MKSEAQEFKFLQLSVPGICNVYNCLCIHDVLTTESPNTLGIEQGIPLDQNLP